MTLTNAERQKRHRAKRNVTRNEVTKPVTERLAKDMALYGQGIAVIPPRSEVGQLIAQVTGLEKRVKLLEDAVAFLSKPKVNVKQAAEMPFSREAQIAGRSPNRSPLARMAE